MKSVTVPDFRLNLSAYINIAKREPVMITTDSGDQQAVLVSPELFQQAMKCLEDKADIEAATAARQEGTHLPIKDLFDELGI